MTSLDLHETFEGFRVVQSNFARRCDAVGDGRDAGGDRGGGGGVESTLRCKLTAMDDTQWSEFHAVTVDGITTDTCSGVELEESERRRNSETEAMRVAAAAALAPDVGCQLLWADSTDLEPQGYALPCAGECEKKRGGRS